MKKTRFFFGVSTVILALSSVLAVKANNKKFSAVKTLYINRGGTWKAILAPTSATTVFTSSTSTNLAKCVVNGSTYTMYKTAATTTPVYTSDTF